MYQLDHYQTIFNLDHTADRCRRVLDEVEAPIKGLFERFVQELSVPDSYVRTYGVTLQTTYHDALNPRYAEQKKDSNIGRKYFVQLMQKVGEFEVNLLTLELNGIERQIQVYNETNFYPIWEAIRTEQMKTILSELPNDISLYFKTGSHTKGEVSRDRFVQEVKEMIKPRKRPWVFFGFTLPLKGVMTEEDFRQALQKGWDYLERIRTYLIDEKQISHRSHHILKLLEQNSAEQKLTLLHHSYQLTYHQPEPHRSGVERQTFLVKDQDQLIVKGQLYFYDFHEKIAPYQVLGLKIDGHSHIFTNVRQLLGEGRTPWWIKKTFTTQSLNNAEVTAQAMDLLKQHGIEVNEHEYFIGTYSNLMHSFEEPIPEIKKKLITAGILFAHVSEKLQLPGPQPTDPEEPNDGRDESEPDWVSHFQFSSIYELIQGSSFAFDKEIIRDLHLNLTALDEKHFVILSGISGTGKTQLARLYANAVYGLDYEADNPYLSIIPVRPDWTDGTSLFGYYSSFEHRYIVPEFLRMLLSAHQERDKPHFVVLDEMNIARVEYYLSDFLSGVESHAEIPLHSRTDVQHIPQKITIPPNLYVLGTVNVDETTHTISDKVLDRAFVMVLSDVSWDGFLQKMDGPLKETVMKEFQLLQEVNDILKPVHLHFGYRSMTEMLRKLYQNAQMEEEHRLNANTALERVILEKVFPKLRGDDGIEDTLGKLKNWCQSQFGERAVTVQTLNRMEKELSRYGATQYWR